MCRFRNRDTTNSNDDTGVRASISRIVVLAKALFEVWDEIHQQFVVLSSRPYVSFIGYVPAPINVVESLPVKLYEKLHKHQEDATQNVGINVHGSMDPDQRACVQRQWNKDEINIICATMAFGMSMFVSLKLLFALIN